MSRPCGFDTCSVSTGIHDGLTFGKGTLDFNGFWSRPCAPCARAHEKAYPEDGPCWPYEGSADAAAQVSSPAPKEGT